MGSILLKIGGIVFLASFLPCTYYAFYRYRLPRKKNQYNNFIKTFYSDRSDISSDIPVIENEYSKADFQFPVGLATFLCLLGSTALLLGSELDLALEKNLLFSGFIEKGSDYVNYQEKSLVALTIGFMGGYVWSIQYIFRRFVTIDLAPAAYFSVSIRLVFASFIALMYRHASDVASLPESTLPPIAFLIGMFPVRGMHYLISQFSFIFHENTKNKSDDLSLDMIEGINSLHKARLSELGIDNAQNLAESNLAELYLKTPYNIKLLLDWIGQAKLYVYFTDRMKSLRNATVRNIFDLVSIGKNKGINELSEATGIPESELNSLYKRIESDVDIDQLVKFKEKYIKISFYGGS